MKHEVRPFDVREAVETGDQQIVEHFREKTFQISGTFVATIQLEGSMNGTDWEAEGAAQSSPGVLEVSRAWRFMRVDTTAFTSGTPVVEMGAFNSRSDGG